MMRMNDGFRFTEENISPCVYKSSEEVLKTLFKEDDMKVSFRINWTSLLGDRDDNDDIIDLNAEEEEEGWWGPLNV